jgi:hypothetical protein
MDKTIVGIVGAVAGLATVGGAQAATPATQDAGGVLAAQSFAELLDPIPNALAALRAADSAAAAAPARDEAEMKVAQLYIGVGHHHHHRSFRHHHHHHRGVVVRVPRRVYGHHHHHHHHHGMRRDY